MYNDLEHYNRICLNSLNNFIVVEQALRHQKTTIERHTRKNSFNDSILILSHFIRLITRIKINLSPKKVLQVLLLVHIKSETDNDCQFTIPAV